MSLVTRGHFDERPERAQRKMQGFAAVRVHNAFGLRDTDLTAGAPPSVQAVGHDDTPALAWLQRHGKD